MSHKYIQLAFTALNVFVKPTYVWVIALCPGFQYSNDHLLFILHGSKDT